MLKVKGDSMINAGIFDGDRIIVEQTHSARNGDIVVALLDDSATVKRFFLSLIHISTICFLWYGMFLPITWEKQQDFPSPDRRK